jgi:hypothetical protein
MISFSDYVLILENTELSNPFYIQKGFPNDIKDFILNYKSNRSPRCHVETAKWYLRLTKEFNVDPNRIKIYRGTYSKFTVLEDEHFWMKVDNYIFDPTFFQFGKVASPTKYSVQGIKTNPQAWAEKNSKEFSSIYS